MKRRLLAALLSMVLVIGLLPTGAMAAESWDGTSTTQPAIEDGIYQIGTAAELAWFRDHVNGHTGCDDGAVLTADIDLGDYNWTPISSGTTILYSGIFDGQLHTVSGLSVTGTAAYQGLFGYVTSATIKNLSVEGVVKSAYTYVGGLIGSTRGTTVENCSFRGTVEYTGTSSSASTYAGGLIGGNQSTASAIKNCVNMANVTGNTVDGILGNSGQTTKVTNCYNTGTITGLISGGRSGGIVGLFSAGEVSSCYNLGTIAGASNTPGGIYGFSSATITNCYYLNPADNSKAGGSPTGTPIKITEEHEADKAAFLEALNDGGDSFVADVANINGGWPVLFWQGPPDLTPSISIKGGTALYTEEGKTKTATLEVTYRNIGTADIKSVTWSMEKKGGGSAEGIAALAPVENNEYGQTVTAVGGGVVAVTVVVETAEETYEKSVDIAVHPQITTIDIVHVDGTSNVSIGQTVKAVVNVKGDGEYDHENLPTLSYQWKYRQQYGTSSSDIVGATEPTYTIPAGGSFGEGDYIHVEIKRDGVVVGEKSVSVRSADYGILYPVAYDPNFSAVPAEIKEETTLILPATHTVGGVMAGIEWSSSSALIHADTGAVTLPETGKTSVILTAKFTYGDNGAYANSFKYVTIWSLAAQAAAASDAGKLETAVEALGSSVLVPKQGTDTNVVDMLKAKLDDASIGVAIKSVREIYAGGGIADDGAITYFYADPNGTRGLWAAQYEVTFTLTKGEASLDKPFIVTVRWDSAQVKAVMASEILSGVTDAVVLGENDALGNVTTDLVLPRAVDGKLWSLVSWTTSDPGAIAVSDENQGTADTLFDPYVGRVMRGATDKEVTLTAAFNFQRAAGNEVPIVMYKTFTVTVKALSGGDWEARRQALADKLDIGFSAAGIRDAVSGEALFFADGAYSAANDVQLPTTRDFGIDGKYFPITVTSSDEDVIVAPDVANAAHLVVYRPLPNESEKTVTVTVTISNKAQGISASKDLVIKVLPLTQGEIDEAIALMDLAKTDYFKGLSQGQYADEYSVTGRLYPFHEAVSNGSGGLTWAYAHANVTGAGIVPDELDNWAAQEAWRVFRSSDPTILEHESLNYGTKPAEDSFVRINSALTHAVFGKYWTKFGDDGAYATFEGLYHQQVSVYVMVAGKNHLDRTPQELDDMKAAAVARISAPITAQFVLMGEAPVQTTLFRTASVEVPLIETTVRGLEAGSTVFEVFRRALTEQGFTYAAQGSYVQAVTDPNGQTLSEKDSGPNSGWIYTVNGVMPSIYMNGYALKEGDVVSVRFTEDYTKEPGYITDEPGTPSIDGGSGAAAPKSEESKELVEAGKNPFADVDEDDWFYQDVLFVLEKGLMNGAEADKFAPTANLSRTMLVTVLYRHAGAPEVDGAASPFSDVSAGQWYSDAVVWAAECGLATGYGDGRFGTDDRITRQDLATLLLRYMKLAGMETPLPVPSVVFADASAIADYAAEAMQVLYGAGILRGTGENAAGQSSVNPLGYATRGEAAALLHRLLELMD